MALELVVTRSAIITRPGARVEQTIHIDLRRLECAVHKLSSLGVVGVGHFLVDAFAIDSPPERLSVNALAD